MKKISLNLGVCVRRGLFDSVVDERRVWSVYVLSIIWLSSRAKQAKFTIEKRANKLTLCPVVQPNFESLTLFQSMKSKTGFNFTIYLVPYFTIFFAGGQIFAFYDNNIILE